jgi:hypothetical protein
VEVKEPEGAGVNLDQAHLQILLQRLDLRLQRAIRLWQQAGQNPDDAFRGLYISDEDADALLSRPLASSWHHGIEPDAAFETAYRESVARLDRAIVHIETTARERHHRLPLVHLREAFGISPFEIDTLLIALAPSVDLRYERIYGYLQDDVTKKRPTVNLVLDLLAEPGVRRLTLLSTFGPGAPLIRQHLLEMQPPADAGRAAPPKSPAAPLLAHTLKVDEGLLHWLFGNYQPHTSLVGSLSVHQVPQHIPDAFISENQARDLANAAVIGNGKASPGWGSGLPIYLFHGADVDVQRAAAALVAQQLRRLLMIVDLNSLIAERQLSPARAVELALRDARLIDALPMLTNWDACLIDETTPAELLYLLTTFPGPVIVAGKTHWVPKGAPRNRSVIEVAFPVPDYAQRRQLWAHFLGDPLSSTSGQALSEALDALAGQFALTSGQIRDAVAGARDRAARRTADETVEKGSPPSVTPDDLFAAARAHSNPSLSRLADKVAPRFGWEDIVLPEDQLAQLREIVDTVRGRPQVLDDWGLGRKLTSSRGITALFSGPPGTGKTMAAQIIAGALGLDLYRIDLSTVVSKYIGETEKNIERIFREAEASNAILFFDEADALFGKRSEVRDSHDRYANIEVSYLLQRMEAYDGVTILATNLRGNLDEAFTRRLQFAVAFPFPEAEERLRIWETLFPAEVPTTSDVDLPLLAERYRLAGGSIRNILVSAAYLAAADGGTLTQAHLLHSTRRELQKMGRLVNDL